jgi:hypothetical protein
VTRKSHLGVKSRPPQGAFGFPRQGHAASKV